MEFRSLRIEKSSIAATLLLAVACSAASAQTTLTTLASKVGKSTAPKWKIVVNNGTLVPGDTRSFNSFNQPSINMNNLVVFRGRSKAGQTTQGEPAHGVYYRMMGASTSSVLTLFDRNTSVPQPNNVQGANSENLTTFIEPPAFPRVDMWSDTMISRGGHPPVWKYVTGTDPITGAVLTTRAGTAGMYVNPLIAGTRNLVTGGSNLGSVPEFDFFRVPEITDTAVKFDVFPGAPAVTNKDTIVFKGNYTGLDASGAAVSKTGVYYRKLIDQTIGLSNGKQYSVGNNDFVLIANSDTLIPGTSIPFGSTAPPSAVGSVVVFAGFDYEDDPSYGGIYSTNITTTQMKLTPLVQIGGAVPGEAAGAVFDRIGEGVSFDGRFVAFWGAWGIKNEGGMRELTLQCPTDGNKNRLAYCRELYGDGKTPGTNGFGFTAKVPVHQGIFVYDTVLNTTWAAAKSPDNFTDFVYWNFSGKVPPPKGGTSGDGETLTLQAGESGGGGEEGGEEDGEPARWRSASFVAVSGLADGKLSNPNMDVVFKARTGAVTGGVYVNPKDGIYHRPGPDEPVRFTTLAETGMKGTLFDPAATFVPVDESGNPTGPEGPLPVTSMGIEREGFRGNTVVINVGMANEFAGWAGIYLTQILK